VLCSHVRGLHAQAGVPEAGARWLFQQILVAVDFCHRLGIALRDIKVRAVAEYMAPEVGSSACSTDFSLSNRQ